MMATWLTGRIGKSTSRHVLGRFGSEKSTVSTATGLPALTALATSSAIHSALVFPPFFDILSPLPLWIAR